MIMRFPQGRKKALALSYDDGVEQDRRLMHILDAHGLHCTFHLNSTRLSLKAVSFREGTLYRNLSLADGVKLYGKGGHEIACHGVSHQDLSGLLPGNTAFEILQDRMFLEQHFHRIVRGFSYPFGAYSPETVQALRACGISYARTAEASHAFGLPEDWLRLQPTCRHADPLLFPLLDRFLADPAVWGSRFFLLWGHSYEFERDDNWSVMESFAEKAGNRGDIWYATLGEVHDYTHAFRSLVTSADGSRIENPSCCEIWLEESGKILSVPAGETLMLEKESCR